MEDKQDEPLTETPAEREALRDIDTELDALQNKRLEVKNGDQSSQDKGARIRFSRRTGRPTRAYDSTRRRKTESAVDDEGATGGTDEFTIPIEAIREFIKLPFDVAATITGHQHWNVNDQELRSFDEATKRYLEKKLPEWMKENLDLVLITQGLARLLTPRLTQEIKIRRKPREDKKE